MSTDRQTVESQRFEIANFCQRQDIVVGKWIEEAISGAKEVEKRKLGKLLKRMKKGDVLICPGALAFPESKRDFSSWMKDRIGKHGLVENQDFGVFPKFVENPSGGRPAKACALTIDCAKGLSMVERNEKGALRAQGP